ncbi:hypothetical protein Mapa_011227 [Marchantia paleacea]|nr:hypothetical protein Mapa_011227 [Marchantia paleacea]
MRIQRELSRALQLKQAAHELLQAWCRSVSFFGLIHLNGRGVMITPVTQVSVHGSKARGSRTHHLVHAFQQVIAAGQVQLRHRVITERRQTAHSQKRRQDLGQQLAQLQPQAPLRIHAMSQLHRPCGFIFLEDAVPVYILREMVCPRRLGLAL